MKVLEIKKYECIFCAMPAGFLCHIGIGVMLSQEDKPTSPKLAPPPSQVRGGSFILF